MGRLWNLLSLSIRFGWRMFFSIQRRERVVVVTNPPSLPLLVGWICRLKRAKPILLVHDLYPDVLVPTGLTHEGSMPYRIIDTLQRHMLRQMNHIVVLGRDMEKRVGMKLPGTEGKISIIPNWGETEWMTPQLKQNNPIRKELGLEEKFVIQFSGNLGRTHGLEDLVALAERLRGDDRIQIFVFGWGAGREWLEQQIEEKGLNNVTLRPPCEKAELGNYLGCCDLFLLAFRPGMEGISVPSRMYNVMAAGNPILAVASEKSELGLVVKEEQIGWVVQPGQIDQMVASVEEAVAQPEALREMGKRARKAAESKYTRASVVAAYAQLVKDLEKDG
jgi:glycosyltransferase involved in cell wall biosynthesis